MGVCQQCTNIGSAKVSYFIVMPIKLQLDELLKRRDFNNLLQHRSERSGIEAGTISDLYDGNLYRRFVEDGLLSNEDNISLTWYTDGVPVFKSSKISMWPIYLSINELPFKERTKRSNLLLVALWFGKNKPDANTFVQKLQPQFDDLLEGQQFTLLNTQVKTIKGILLYGTCDLPAKAQFLNLVQFNGLYGCPVCLCSGGSFDLPSGGRTYVFPYVANPLLRTTQETIHHGRIALGTNNPVMGVKGPTIFSHIMPDFIMGTTIDRMHAVDGGVVKKMLTLWFDATYSNCVFSLVPVIDVINERLLQLKPPKFIHRMPRSVNELLHWKCSELKTWLFYYSVPVLQGVLENRFFDHYLLLVAGISYLSSDRISYAMIYHAENFLKKFVREFEELYGLQFCSLNIHLLLHLSQCVRNNGPLWSYLCYQYENLNGQFLNIIHGTCHIDTQISRAHFQLLRMQRYLEELPEGPIKEFCYSKKKQVKILQRISHDCYSVGIYNTVHYNEDPVLQQIFPDPADNEIWRIYLRLLKNNKLFISEKYQRSLQTQSSYVVYKDDMQSFHLGSIYCFMKKSVSCNCRNNNCTCNGMHYAVIRTITSNGRFQVRGDNDVSDFIPHLHHCSIEENFILVPNESISSICIYINIDDNPYLAIPINTKEDE